MVGTTSIGGLASGLDTASIIDQLMQLEAVPQNRLKARVTSEQGVITALQTVNTKVSLLASAAEKVAATASWGATTASSTNAALTVAADTGATPARLSVTVTGVARSHQLGFAEAHALSDVVTGAATTVRIDRFDGTPVDLETGDGTLQGLVTAINDPANATGLRASTIRVGDGSYRLLVESAETGVAQDFTLTRSDGTSLLGGASVRSGADASIDLGAGLVVTSSSNTFTDLLPGVDLTVSPDAAVGTTATVAVTHDTAAASAAVKSLVDALNTALAEIDTQTAYNSGTKTAGKLVGDAGLRNLRSELTQALFPADRGSLAPMGIQLDRNGKVTFDQSAFDKALAADPAGVAARFTAATDGLGTKLAQVADQASDPITGSITAMITGRKSGVERLNDSIDAWDQRLELRKDALTRQFTALETAMSQMSSQSNWLSGQLSSLPSWNS